MEGKQKLAKKLEERAFLFSKSTKQINITQQLILNYHKYYNEAKYYGPG